MDIEKIAREEGASPPNAVIGDSHTGTWEMTQQQLLSIASRIRAEAMEEAARICEGEAAKWDDGASIVSWGAKVRCAKAIRAAGKEA